MVTGKPDSLKDKYATATEVEELRGKVLGLTRLVEELSQAVQNLQSQVIAVPISPSPNQHKAKPYVENILPPIIEDESMGDLYAESLNLVDDLDAGLDLLAKTIDSLEVDIEDKVFAIWQGVAIRQAEENFYGHPVPLDLIHELGFQSMPMNEFLEFLSHLNDASLELIPSNKHLNYVVGGVSVWYITFRNS